MTFHTWTLLYIGTALFSLGVGVFLLRSEKKPTCKICLVSILFIMAAWATFDFIASLVDDPVTSTLAIKIIFIILGFTPVLFFLIPYTMRYEMDNKILILLTIPIILAFLVLSTDNFATVEYLPYGYHINYNVSAIVTWCIVSIIAFAGGFYLFYDIYSDTSINNKLKTKIKLFCMGCAIAPATAIMFNVFLVVLYDIPPLGSIFTSIGVGIVFLCFRL